MSEPDLFRIRREIEIEKRIRQLRRDNAIEFFRPHAKQEQFYAAANFRYRYARTGNRFGKSEMGAAEDVAWAIGYRPWYPPNHPLRTLGIPSRPTKGLIITTDWDKSTEVFTELSGEKVGKLIKYIPKECLGRPTRNHSGAIDHIPVKHVSGGWSVIHFDTVKSYKQNPQGTESSAWDWIHIDEPCPEGMFKAAARGLVDTGGSVWFTCTPITEAWIDQSFIPDLESQSKASIGNVILEDLSRWMMTGSMYDNPHNTEEDIKLFISWLTPEEREARINGTPLAYAGLVYKEFKWDLHVWRDKTPPFPDWLPPRNYCIRIAVDYHFRKNDAVLFTAVSPEGHIYVYDEIWDQLLVKDEVEEIKIRLNNREYMPVLMEPLASTPNKVTELTAMDQYRASGLVVLPATKDPVNGIRAVKALLRERDRNGNPVIYVNPACRRFLFEISRGFIWDAEKNQPIKNNDDMMENLYRLALHGFQYVEPSTYSAIDDFPTDLEFEREIDRLLNPFEFDSFEPEPSKFKTRYRS